MIRALALAAALAVLAAGCSFVDDEVETAGRVDRCVERLLSRASPEHLARERREVVERYARVTYCDRFDNRGWVNADGTLSLDAHRWLVGAGSSRCAVAAEPGKPPSDEPCPEQWESTLDCALLHHVPKDEVRAYLRKLRRGGPLECDDGTPLDELGAR